MARWNAPPRAAVLEPCACACLALWLLASACAGDVLVVATQSVAAPDGGVDASDVPEPSSPDAGGLIVLDECPPTPSERREAPGCWPSSHVGSWRGYFIGQARYETQDGVGAPFPEDGVALELGDDGSGWVSFGQTPTRTAAECGGDCTPPGRLSPGYRYPLLNLQLLDARDDAPAAVLGAPPLRAGARMTFVIDSGAAWQRWCEIQPVAVGRQLPPTCICDEDGCRANAPRLGLALSMSGDEKALRGAYVPGAPALDQARLELSRQQEAP